MLSENEGSRAPTADRDDDTAHDVTILYDPSDESYVMRPNTDDGLYALLSLSPIGCAGLTVGAKSVKVPWIGAMFDLQALQEQYNVTVRERVIAD